LAETSQRIENALETNAPTTEILEFKEVLEETEAEILSLIIGQITDERRSLRVRQANLRQGIDDAINILTISVSFLCLVLQR
jgi:hypothetical protein